MCCLAHTQNCSTIRADHRIFRQRAHRMTTDQARNLLAHIYQLHLLLVVPTMPTAITQHFKQL